MKLPLREVAAAIDANGKFDGDIVAQGYSIDSRTIRAGELFFAVQGERFDAHQFVVSVLANGAAGAVVAKSRAAEFREQKNVFEVENPLAALQKLGNHVRRKWGKRVIGLTGSAGKTTTKDATAAVLATRFRTLKSMGNLNNHFGVPLQLLRLEPEDEVAVIEMGMNHAGEITLLCEIAEPDWAIVTNVGTAHAGNFADGIEGVMRAKRELPEHTRPGGALILNADDERVRTFGAGYSGTTVLYGTSSEANVRAENIRDLGALGTECELVVSASGVSGRESIKVPLIGRHNLYNCLAAVAAGVASKIPLAACAAAIGKLTPGDKRGEVLFVAGATVINDCYNSNPRALKAMVEALRNVPASRRIVVAGEMLELGADSATLHRECGAFIAESVPDAKHDILIGVRGDAESMVNAARERGMEAVFVATPAEAGEWLAFHLREGDAVLLKGSRGVRLEGALAKLLDIVNTRTGVN